MTVDYSKDKALSIVLNGRERPFVENVLGAPSIRRSFSPAHDGGHLEIWPSNHEAQG